MTLKQINILISLTLFLFFSLILAYVFQFISSQYQYAGQQSPELIANYNIKLNTDNVLQLAQLIDSSFQPANTKELGQKPVIAVAEPAGSQEIKEKEVKINLYNGNGIAGDASRTADILTGKGYLIGAIDNADKKSYSKTIIFFHENNASLAYDLQNDLESYYNDIRLESSQDDIYSIKVILGQPAQASEGGDK